MKIIRRILKTINPYNRSKKQRLNTSLEGQEVSVSFLCLIVPALALENVRKNYPIDSEYIKELIDNSLYFLCIDDIDEADEIWELLETTDEDYRNISEQREVYVRIEIDNAEEMVGKKVPYILKRNLPVNAQGVVRKLACLKYLSVSGLEKFNRI